MCVREREKRREEKEIKKPVCMTETMITGFWDMETVFFDNFVSDGKEK